MVAARIAGFELEQQGDILIVTPTANLCEVGFPQVETGAEEILDRLNDQSIRGVILDFGRTDYFGSTALGFFLRLWKRMQTSNRRMAFCNLSSHEREILDVTKLVDLWSLCGSREEALQAVRAAR
jgi:anti-anti-sigma factor